MWVSRVIRWSYLKEKLNKSEKCITSQSVAKSNHQYLVIVIKPTWRIHKSFYILNSLVNTNQNCVDANYTDADDSLKTKRGGDQETEIRTDDVPGSSNTFSQHQPTPTSTFSQLASATQSWANMKSWSLSGSLKNKKCRVIMSTKDSMDSSSSHPPPSHLLLRWFWSLNGPGL